MRLAEAESRPLMIASPVAGARSALCYLVALWLATLGVAKAADAFRILRVEAQLDNNVLTLSVDADINLSGPAKDALHNSVPLTIVLRMQVLSRRRLLWDEVVADVAQRYQLKYHALAKQYVVTKLSDSTLHVFPTRGAAQDFMGVLRGFPLLDRSLLPDKNRSYGRVRAELDVESLPAPLRPVAYFSKAWRLTSEWYPWQL